jgi:hypothetical protein
VPADSPLNVPRGIRLFEALQSPQLGEPGASTLESLIRAEASSYPSKGSRPVQSVNKARRRVVPIGVRWSPPHSSKLGGFSQTSQHRRKVGLIHAQFDAPIEENGASGLG